MYFVWTVIMLKGTYSICNVGKTVLDHTFDTRYFSVIPPPPAPHQKIRKTVEIVPEKIKKSSIEIVQILVLSKYN